MIRRVAIAIPALNEARHIGGLIAAFTRLGSDQVVEILVADGGSTDGTREIVRDAARNDPRVRLIDNPQRLQAAGLNRAVAAADPRANTVIRIDAHARYPDDYVEKILEAFEASGAAMVATRLRTVGITCLQRGIAAASNSRLGTGGSAHRVGGTSGFVDHGHHAGMDRTTFEASGGYDETFVANEDAELDYRIRRLGARIWLASDIEVEYQPRASLARLAAQYWRYGRGRARTFLKHGERLRPRQLLPAVLVLGLGGCLLLAPVQPLFLLIPVSYAGAVALGSIGLAIRSKSRCALFAAPAAIVMHLAWGTGFIATLLSARRGRRASPSRGIVGPKEGAPLLVPRMQRK